MKSMVRPALSTAAAGPSQAPPAPVDNSAPRSTHPEPTYKSGKTVPKTGTTSLFVTVQQLDTGRQLCAMTGRIAPSAVSRAWGRKI
jgi:hypothetical protein